MTFVPHKLMTMFVYLSLTCGAGGMESFFVGSVESFPVAIQEFSSQSSVVGAPYAVLEGAGEAYFARLQAGSDPGLERTLVIRIEDGRDPVRGLVFIPGGKGMEARKVELSVKSTGENDRREFYQAKKAHYERLLQNEPSPPGAAWFRHQYRQAAEALGEPISPPMNARRSFGFRLNDPVNTYALFSGGRAVSENLQLDSLLPTSQTAIENVPLEELEGITVKEFDWKALLMDRSPELDSSAALVPHDQHAVFFASFDAFLTSLDHLQELAGPLATGVVPDAVYGVIQSRYEKQLGLPLDETVRQMGRMSIDNVTLTGGDPYLRTGTDLTFIFSSKNPDQLQSLILAGAAATASKAEAKLANGEILGVPYKGYRNSDRSVCCYWARVGDFVLLTNSLAQLERLIGTHQGTTVSLAQSEEYRYFRDRYPRGGDDETGLVVISDATIRRWCGPRWRIATSRRSHAMAVQSEMQAVHLDDILRHKKGDPEVLVHPPFAFPVREPLTLDASGLRSPTFGTLEFQTPISELVLKHVTQAEADLYRQWRDGYQHRWRNFFDPIALQFQITDQRIALDLSVMPLIEGSDYQQFISVVKGSKIGEDQGDRHADALLHFAISLNHASDNVRMGTTLLGNMAPQIGIDPLSWLGETVAFYIDNGPIWKTLAETPKMERSRALLSSKDGIPIALCAEVKSGLRLAAFLAGARAFLEQTAPGLTVWTNETYQNEPYVKISASERARSDQGELDHVSLYYLASGDMLLLTLDESLLHRVIERRRTHSAEPDSTKGIQEVTPNNAPPWLGENLCLHVDHQFLSLLDYLLAAEHSSRMQRMAWANLPILNEWKGRFPDRDPVAFHESVWKQRLISPGGGTYQWNATWQTMESTLYGHPLQPKDGPRLPEELRRFRFANLGVTFDNHGLRSEARLDK